MKSSGGSFEAKHIQAQDSALVRELRMSNFNF